MPFWEWHPSILKKTWQGLQERMALYERKQKECSPQLWQSKPSLTDSLHFAWLLGLNHILPTNGFCTKPLKVKLLVGEQISQPSIGRNLSHWVGFLIAFGRGSRKPTGKFIGGVALTHTRMVMAPLSSKGYWLATGTTGQCGRSTLAWHVAIHSI